MGALGGPSSLGRERPGQRGTSPPASSKTKNQEPEARNKEQGRRRTCVLISTLRYPCALGMVTYELTRTAIQHELHEHLHPQIRPSQTRGIGLRRKTIRALVGASSDRCEGGMAGVVYIVEDPHCVCSLDQQAFPRRQRPRRLDKRM